MKKRSDKQKAKDRAWKCFADYIKLRDSDWRGICKCCTCGREIELGTQECQAGHLVHGRSNAVLFDERIVHAQCSTCNSKFIGNGEQGKYTLFMLKKGYTDKEIEELFNLKHTAVKYSTHDYIAIAEMYKQKYLKEQELKK